MERTFSMEYSAMKGERAERRSNKKKHAQQVDCGGDLPPGRGHFRAEHGSSAAQKARDPFFKETQWAARRRDDEGADRPGGATVKAGHGKADRQKAREKRSDYSWKTNQAHRDYHTEEDEVGYYRKPQHTLAPTSFRLFGPAPPRPVPQRRRRALAAEEAPASRRRKPGADALTQRISALNHVTPWRTGLDEVVKVAAARLRRLRPSNRPASGPALERWLKHQQNCSSARVDMQMTPGALAEALLPLLEDAPHVRRIVAPFVNAGRGVDVKDPGPSEEDAAAAAKRARHQLHAVGEQTFSSWPWPQVARWLCSQSYVLCRVGAGALIAELRRLGVIVDVDGGEDGRTAYDEAALASIGECGKRGEWSVMDLEKVARVASCQKSRVLLGSGLVLAERRKSLRLAELSKLKVAWLEAAVSQLGERAPGILSLRAQFNKAQTAVVIYACALGSEESIPAEDACKALVRVVKADIAERHSPRELRIENLVFRGSLRELLTLERWLSCVIELERDGEGYLTGNAKVSFSRQSQATDEQAREILRLTFSPEPLFRCPGLLDAAEAEWLAAEPHCQHCLVNVLLHMAQVILEAWQPEEAAPADGRRGGCLDLCGWPCAGAWGGYEGDLDGAPAWFLAEAVPRAKEDFLKHWEDRLTWFPEAREWSKFLREEGERERNAEENLQKAALSGKKVLIAGGTADGGYPSKRW